jgi:hypothetical protein
MKSFSHCTNSLVVIHQLSINTNFLSGRQLSDSSWLKASLLKMNIGGKIFPAALMQHMRLVFVPLSPLIVARPDVPHIQLKSSVVPAR